MSGRYTEGRQFLDRALDLAADEPAEIRARLLVASGWCAYHLSDVLEAEDLCRRGLDAARDAAAETAAGAEDVGTFHAAWARILLAGLAWSAGDGRRVRELLAGAEDWTRIPGAVGLAARAQVLLSNITFVEGDLAEAARSGRRAVEIARTAPNRENLALALICSTHAALVAGDLDTAAALLDEAVTTATASGDGFALLIAHYQRARLLALRGDAPAAEVEAARSWSAGRAGRVRLVDSLAPVAESAAALARHDVEGAAEALERATANGHAIGFSAFEPTWLADRACLAARRGDDASAELLADQVEAVTDDRPAGLAIAAATWARSLVAWHRGDLPLAERRAREATGAWLALGARPDGADGVELLGTLACARGRWAEGVRLLAAAAAARDGLGYRGAGVVACRDEATAAAEEARRELGDGAVAELRAAGAAMSLEDALAYASRGSGGRKRPGTGWASLTPAELQVVELVAEGLRNDTIATRLYLSSGTVKNHLSHVFTKLGVTNRAELAAEAMRRDA